MIRSAWVIVARIFYARRFLPKIRGTQPCLPKQQTFREVKEKMQNNRYDYARPENRIGGYQKVGRNIFYVGDGHHRMAAAIDSYWQTGNTDPILKLISYGRWSLVIDVPIGAQTFPAASFLGRILNFFAFT